MDINAMIERIVSNEVFSSGVITVLAREFSKIRDEQQLASDAFDKGTSIIEAYNLQNETLGARLDKARKAFNETALELGASLNPILLKSVKGSTLLIKALAGFPKWLKENAGLIVALAYAMTIYTLAVNRARIANLAHIAVE
jgi:TP901 family phage tail tape measure protein